MRGVSWVLGAGEGNRTLVFSLEGCCSTIELHPRHRLPNTAGRRSQLPPGPLSPAFRPLRTGPVPPGPPALNSGGVAAYIEVSRNQRKEVIQCLLPSAVTSLGSPAKLSIRAWHRGALSPGPASKRSGATGSPRRAFSFEDSSPTSEAVDREHGRALAAAALGNALAVTLDRAGVIAVMAGLVVQVAIF